MLEIPEQTPNFVVGPAYNFLQVGGRGSTRQRRPALPQAVARETLRAFVVENGQVQAERKKERTGNEK